jgi:hypothetical protein
MIRGRSFVLLGWLTLACARSPRATIEHPPEDAVCQPTATGQTCLITQPNVRRFMSSYPQVRFRPGSYVTVSGSGCVDVGGAGRSWYSYINPSGNHAHRHHFGLIWVPGATQGLQPLRSVAGWRERSLVGERDTIVQHAPTVLRIPSDFPDTAQLYLRLGYRDNDYSDNGYAGRTSADDRQCGLIPGEISSLAALQISIDSVPPTAITTPRRAMFDLVWDSVDANGFPAHPDWAVSRELRARFNQQFLAFEKRPQVEDCGDFRYRYDTRVYGRWPAGVDIDSTCTTQHRLITLDEASGISRVWCSSSGLADAFHGHLNWFPVTYSGRMTWRVHAIDNDYTMDFFVADSAGQTRHNQLGRFHVEQNAEESVARFSTPWWSWFLARSHREKRELLNRSISSPIDGLGNVPGVRTIMTGLFGLDAVHEAHSELHPVYLLAMEVSRDPAKEVWAIYGRRQGNEGDCAQLQHHLQLIDDELRLVLPWRAGAAAFEVLDSTVFRANQAGARASGPTIYFVPGQFIMLSFRLPHVEELVPGQVAPDESARVHGELHIRWLQAARVVTTPTQPSAGPVLDPPPEEEDNEKRMISFPRWKPEKDTARAVPASASFSNAVQRVTVGGGAVLPIVQCDSVSRPRKEAGWPLMGRWVLHGCQR